MICNLRTALAQADPEDLSTILHYVNWVKFRRSIHQAFYRQVHWIQRPRNQYHWL